MKLFIKKPGVSAADRFRKGLILNKYVLTVVLFVVWMMFFDKQDYFYYRNIKKEHEELVRDTLYYYQEIQHAQAQIKKLKGDKKELERFARETYFMKKDDEVVFVFLPDTAYGKSKAE